MTHLIFFYINQLVLPLIHIPCMFALLYAYNILVVRHDSPKIGINIASPFPSPNKLLKHLVGHSTQTDLANLAYM